MNNLYELAGEVFWPGPPPDQILIMSQITASADFHFSCIYAQGFTRRLHEIDQNRDTMG